MKKFNKITSFMLAVCAVTSLMSVSASATTIPTKSNQDMKIINLSDSINENELNEIKNSVGAYLIYDGNMIELSDSILTIEDIATSEYRSANSNSYKLTLNADINEQEEKNSRKIVSDSGDKNSSNVNASATLQLIWTDNPGINNVIDQVSGTLTVKKGTVKSAEVRYGEGGRSAILWDKFDVTNRSSFSFKPNKTVVDPSADYSILFNDSFLGIYLKVSASILQ